MVRSMLANILQMLGADLQLRSKGNALEPPAWHGSNDALLLQQRLAQQPHLWQHSLLLLLHCTDVIRAAVRSKMHNKLHGLMDLRQHAGKSTGTCLP